MRLGGLFMRVKRVLWSLLLSYGLTGLFLLLLAFLLFQFELGEGAAAAGIVFFMWCPAWPEVLPPAELCVRTVICGELLQGCLIMFYCFWYLFWHRENGI